MQKVASLTRSQIRLVSVGGQHVINRHQQLVRHIQARVGDRAALFLTDPQPNPASDDIAWYTPLRGPVEAVADLDPARKEAVLAECGRIFADLGGIVAALRAATPAGVQSDADYLAAILDREYPESYLYVCQDQPLLVGWACDDASPERAAVPLISAVRLAPPPPSPPSPPPPSPPPELPAAMASAAPAMMAVQEKQGWGCGCLTWLVNLLVLLILLALLFLLPRGCAVLPVGLPFVVPGLSPPVAPKVDALLPTPEEQALRDEISRLQKEIETKRGACPLPPPAVPTPEPEPEPEPEPSPSPAPVPPPKITPVPKPEAAKPPEPVKPLGRDLVIPDDVAENKTLDFLEGCWVSITGLHLDDEPISLEYCLNKDGKGKVKMSIGEGRRSKVCAQEPAQATFNKQGDLVFDLTKNVVMCKGHRVSRWTIVCKPQGNGPASCHGLHDNGGTFEVMMQRRS